MRPTIRPIDRAAQGLSKTPLIAVIGPLEGKRCPSQKVRQHHFHFCFAKIKDHDHDALPPLQHHSQGDMMAR
eukprot:scaffold12549_cov162-Skeletonema_marinoi.AAC.1